MSFSFSLDNRTKVELFHQVVAVLSRLGPQLRLELTDEKFFLKTLSPLNSAFFSVVFDHSFFDSLQMLPPPARPFLALSLDAKTFALFLRTHALYVSLALRFSAKSASLAVEMTSLRKGVSKKTLLRVSLEDTQIDVTPDTSPTASCTFVLDFLLAHFALLDGCEEFAFVFAADTLVLKTYPAEDAEQLSSVLRLEIDCGIQEFSCPGLVAEEMLVNKNEFLLVLKLAAALAPGGLLQMRFTESDHPAFFSLLGKEEEPLVVGTAVLMTLDKGVQTYLDEQFVETPAGVAQTDLQTD